MIVMEDKLQKIRWFDLHCDTLSACAANGKELYQNDFQIDLLRGTAMADGGSGWTQVFACFLPDALSVNEAWELFLKQREVLLNAIKSYPEQISFGMNTPCRAILSVEGGRLIGHDMERIHTLSDMGVSFLTLVWNGENDIASGTSSDGSNNGLTSFGKEAVPVFEECGITVDISHLSDKGIDDVFSLSKKPVAATHSNSRAVCNVKRNLTDEHIRQLVKTNGLCGINYYPPFIKNGAADGGDYEPSDMQRQIDHILSLGGENILALGSDFDGASMPSFIKDITGLYRLYSYVVEWYDKSVADKLFYQNATNFYQKQKAAF